MPLSNKTSTGGPVLGFLALAPTVALFTLNHGGILHTDPVVMTMLLLIGGTLQVVAGLKSRQSGQMSSAAAFIPLGLFWFSMIALYQLPAIGIGHTSSPLIMLTYLTMWGLFVAILYRVPLPVLPSSRPNLSSRHLSLSPPGCLLKTFEDRKFPAICFRSFWLASSVPC